MKNNWMPISGKLPKRNEVGRIGLESKVVQVKLENNLETDGIFFGPHIGWKIYIPQRDVFTFEKYLNEDHSVTHWRDKND